MAKRAVTHQCIVFLQLELGVLCDFPDFRSARSRRCRRRRLVRGSEPSAHSFCVGALARLRFPLEFSSFPHTQTFTRNSKVIAQHPRRPWKAPTGTIVYRRFCTEVEKVLEFHVVDPDDAGDLNAFHKWMNDERVNSGWGERGDLGKHREYLEEVLIDPSVLPLIMCWDGERMGYCEIVWIKVNSVPRNIKRFR